MFDGMNLFGMISNICKSKNKYAVYIAFEQFDLDKDQSPRWDTFVACLAVQFGDQAINVLSSVIAGEILFFSDKDVAWKLYNIMNNSYFYSKEYAAFFGPEWGCMDENT